MAAIQRDIIEHTQVEDALKTEKAFTESALNSLQDVFYVFDLNGRFLRWNKLLSAISGYSDEEISTKKPTDFFLGEDIQNILNAIEMVVKNGTARVEAKFVTKNGEHINYEFIGTLLKDYDGKPLGIEVGRNITERKRLESEYKTILHSAMDGFYVTDLQGSILDVNDSYCSLIGYSREQMLNMSIKDIEAIETEEMFAERIHRILKVGRDRFETRHKCKDGRIVEIEASVIYKEDGGGKFFVFIRDITERKLGEYALKKSMEFSETVFNSMNDVISVIDVNNFRIIDVNSVFLEKYGIKKDAVLGKTCYEITHQRADPCTPPDDICPLVETLNTGKPSTTEHVHYMKGGEKRYVEVSTSPIIDENGKVVKVIHVSKDITERMQMLEQLRQKNQLVKATLESLPYPFYVIETKNYIIKLANSAANKQGLREGSYCYVVHNNTKPCDTKDHQCPLRKVEKTKKPVTTKHIHFDENGKPRDVDVHCYPIFDNGGNVNQVIEYTLDITDLQKIKEIRLENERLVFADKAKSEFLAIMSHELRTPLNAIIGFSELLKVKTMGNINEKQESYVDNIRYGGKHLLDLINDILDLSQAEAGKIELVIEKISVPHTINEVLILIEEKAAKNNIIINEEFDPQLEWIEADKQRIKQVLFNLLSNAVKFSKEEGGTITIATKREGDMARISVSDSGIGIKERDIGKLFKEFQQLDSGSTRKYGGTGLGLVITKKLIELHGGKIIVESRYGEGSTFSFSIPIKVKKGELNE
jgi:PAS domain S-box-containing protein